MDRPPDLVTDAALNSAIRLDIPFPSPDSRPSIVLAEASIQRRPVYRPVIGDASQLSDFLTRTLSSVRHDLSSSYSDVLGMKRLLSMASTDERAWWEALELGYADPDSSERLPGRIADLYGDLSSSQIVCCAGAHDAAACVAYALLSADDHAIVVLPIYEPLEWTATERARVTGVSLDPPHLQLDIGRIAAAVTPRTKMILMNFPNSPTGAQLDEQTLIELVALCRKHGLWLVNDEVYRHLVLGEPPPPVADLYERGISIDAVTKAFGLPGLRVGWAACQDAKILEAVSLVKARRSSYVATPSDVLACIAISNASRLTAQARATGFANRGKLRTTLAPYPDLFSADMGESLLFACPRYFGSDGPLAFANRLLSAERTLVLPTTLWRSSLGVTPQDRIRIGIGLSESGRGLAALATHLERQSS